MRQVCAAAAAALQLGLLSEPPRVRTAENAGGVLTSSAAALGGANA